jgi:aerobic carbon-monoxide dehydrogenase small subunit
MLIRLTVNGEPRELDVPPDMSLLRLLRERLDLPGTKNACEQGECGSCAVWLDGTVVCSCLVAAVQLDGSGVRTVESLVNGSPHPVQDALVEAGAVQCGFCTPGVVVAAVDLLEREQCPSELEIREALSGHLCRCTGYQKIVDAVVLASKEAP